MDSMITAAARLLAAGDLLGALKRVALRDDGPALALRGIIMAQLGDLVRARVLLKAAARAFGPKEAVSRARCLVAEAEIALVSRDLTWPAKTLAGARTVLEAHGDRLNAAHARHIEVRRLLLIGHFDEAERLLSEVEPEMLPPPLRTSYELAVAGIAIRRLQTSRAHAALNRAEGIARAAGIRSLIAEVESVIQILKAPAASLVAGTSRRLVLLEEVEALVASDNLVVDACRYSVRVADKEVSLTTRPVLFGLAKSSARRGPAMSRGERLLPVCFAARMPTNPIEHGYASKSDGCVASSADWRMSGQRRTASRSRRYAQERSSCWRRLSRNNMASAGLPVRRRILVQFSAGDRTRLKLPHHSTRPRCAGGGRQGAIFRPWPRTTLDDFFHTRVSVNFVTPRSTHERLG